MPYYAYMFQITIHAFFIDCPILLCILSHNSTFSHHTSKKKEKH